MAHLAINATNSKFENVNGAVGSYNTVTVTNIGEGSQSILRARLKPVKYGHSVPPCMPLTREKILEEIDQWLNNVEAPNVLWVSGNPGVGKSTIAASLESRLTKRRRARSSFFFKRGDVNLSDPAAVWRTVAFHLAQCDLKFANNLVQVLEESTLDPGNADIAFHFQVLIKETLTKTYDADSPSNTIPIIIIDALDECDSKGPQRWTFLETLTQWEQLPKKFKLIFTGRDESFISQKLRSISKPMPLVSGSDVDAQATGDIRRFLERRFEEELGRSSLPEWLGNDVLNTLTARAAGLFIWAETVVRFVREGLHERQLQLVLHGDIGEGNPVAELYEQILEFSFRRRDDGMLNIFKLVVSTIILAKVPLRLVDVAEIVSERESEVEFILDGLSSVISRSTDQCLYIGHLSFTEFLCDSKRGSNQNPKWFFIDRSTWSQKFAMACFRLMKDGLKFNICGLQSSYLLNDEVENLPQTIEEKISSPLFYSCRFWVAHLLDTTINPDGPEPLMKEVEDFLYNHVLFWLEVMSLKKEVAAANIALLTVSPRIREDLANLAQDTSRFVVNFDIPISTCAPHIYVSALPFSPMESLIAKQYRSRFPRTLDVISGGDQKWPPATNIFRGHTNWVWSVTFSPDGKWVASGSADHTIRIWDAQTGDVVGFPFEGHTDSVYSIAFSPDGQRLASGSRDNTICIWDVDTGKTIAGPFKGHADTVFSVAFSPDGKWVASGSGDNTVRIWDSGACGVVAHILKGHTNWVFSTTFSPNGKRVASGSVDNTIRIWNAKTGEQVAGPFKGHADAVYSLAFSPDSKRVVSGSGDNTIRIWDAVTAEEVVGPFKDHTDRVNSVAFSPDGKWVASGSDDNVIRIWNATTGEVVPFEGHSKSVEAVAFSPDGKHVASGSGDNTIRIWDAGTSRAVAGSFEDQAKSVLPMALSLDSNRMTAGSSNATIRFWDVKAGQVGSPVECHTDVVVFIAPSLDGQQQVSGSHLTLRMWDATTDQVITSPFADQVGRLKIHKDRGGWAVCSDLARSDSSTSDHGLLFWVPESCREAVCGIETLAVFNKRTTRLDLGQFVHGTSWMQCYAEVLVHPGSSTDNISSESSCCSLPDSTPILSHPPVSNSEVDEPVGRLRVSDHPPPANQSDPSSFRYFQTIAFVLVPLIAVYYFRTISGSK